MILGTSNVILEQHLAFIGGGNNETTIPPQPNSQIKPFDMDAIINPSIIAANIKIAIPIGPNTTIGGSIGGNAIQGITEGRLAVITNFF